MRCRTSYCQALDLCVQEIFLQSNLHCHLEKPQLFAVSRTDLLSSLEPNQCCYPECPLGKGAQKGVFFPQYILAQRTIEVLVELSTSESPSFGRRCWGTFMRPRSRYEQICHLICRRNATKCQLVPVRIPSLLEQNVLKAVCRTQIQGSCKVYAGKTNWETLLKAVQARSEEHLKHSCR